MKTDPIKKFPKKGSEVRIGTGDTRVVMSVDSIAGKVNLRNPRNGMMTQASARKVHKFQQGDRSLQFVEKKIKK